jgi:hypothetical protein
VELPLALMLIPTTLKVLKDEDAAMQGLADKAGFVNEQVLDRVPPGMVGDESSAKLIEEFSAPRSRGKRL